MIAPRVSGGATGEGATMGSTPAASPMDLKASQIDNLVRQIHMDDVFVLRLIEDDRFVHVGGAGFGVGWAEIVELHLHECPDAHRAHTDMKLVQATGTGMRNIFGPYHARAAFFIPVSHDVLVIVGTRADGFQVPSPDALWRGASEIAKNIYSASPAKHLADELEELHAIKDILSVRPDSIAAAAQLVVDCIARALLCELGILWLNEGDFVAVTQNDPTITITPSQAGTVVKNLYEANPHPVCIQDAQATPLPYPLRPQDGIVSYLIIPIPNIGAMLVAHTNALPRGFSNLCQSLSRNLSTAGALVLQNALHQNKLQKREKSLRKSKQEAEYATQAKSYFLANMSHELRTPLNAIIGCSAMLKEATFGPVGSAKNKEYIGIINDAGTHLLNLIGDILDLSKVEAGEEKLVESSFDVDDKVNRCLTILKERAFAKQLALVARVPDPFPNLQGDAVKFKQILLNLLSNAIKFTPDGGKITVDAILNDDHSIALKVTDTGIGIAPQNIAKVIQPFEQTNDDMTKPQEGTGLGLALCKSLMELHGGTIKIDSALGKGSTVTIHFPPERTASSP